MRCKNCGTYNDDNRYICETCGSPLYDEDDISNLQQDSPQTSVNSQQNSTADTNGYTADNAASSRYAKSDKKDNGSEKSLAEKKSIIVIAILAVVLVAIIISVAVVAHNKSNNNDEALSSPQTTVEPGSELTSYNYNRSTEPTSKRTTETTTKQTTTAATTTATTTEAPSWYINASSSGGGTVSGDGKYKNGDKVTLTASPDDGYSFDGWYSDGVKVSSSASYTFTANENASFSAVFYETETNEDNSQPDVEIVYGN